MSRAPTGGDSDSDEDMDKEYQIELLYHAGADGAVQAERLRVDAKSTWPDVKKFAQQRSGHADFALEDEDGGRLGAQTPLAWIRADQQGRPYRRAVVKRRGVDADGVFERRGVVAPAHVGLVANTINAGMDTTTLLSESIENSVQHGATLVKIFIDPVRAQRLLFFSLLSLVSFLSFFSSSAMTRLKPHAKMIFSTSSSIFPRIANDCEVTESSSGRSIFRNLVFALP